MLDCGFTSSCAIAMHHIHHTVRQTNFLKDCRHQIRGGRRQLRWLAHTHIATDDCWRHFHTEQHEREIPRSDQSNDTDRITMFDTDRIHHLEIGRSLRLNHSRVFAKRTNCARNVNDARHRHRFTHIFGFSRHKRIKILFFLHLIGNLLQPNRTLSEMRFSPFWIGRFCRTNGRLNVAAIAVWNIIIDAVGGWIDVLNVFTGDGRHQFTVDEITQLIHCGRSRRIG
mmetsp:Transcript_32008/g.51750  ORF Transcript_32008/g.51750 Transcript_32008/m.51750 type:complete len:226 (-) Transcript_32008:1183-1860(-)